MGPLLSIKTKSAVLISLSPSFKTETDLNHQWQNSPDSQMPAPDSQKKRYEYHQSLIAESNGLSFWLDDGFTQFFSSFFICEIPSKILVNEAV